MSYKHRNSSSYRKKSTDKLLKKQNSSTDDIKTEQDKKIETIELKEDDFPKRAATTSENKQEETSFIFPKVEKKTGIRNIVNFCMYILQFLS